MMHFGVKSLWGCEVGRAGEEGTDVMMGFPSDLSGPNPCSSSWGHQSSLQLSWCLLVS